MDRTVIAVRKLAFGEKGGSERKPLLIRIFAPQPVNPGSHLFRPDADTSSCIFEFEGILDVKPNETFGADSIQALQLAIVDIEAIVKRLSDRYDFFFPTGEGYFEE
jgi:uncharacterized protein DUF6968